MKTYFVQRKVEEHQVENNQEVFQNPSEVILEI